ncbi:MAG TPA: tetratricopeptide repeat protein, partial [Casimicrobiaceae bacterium]|nr:tetratricopeptide repeat protein [Casimicrobiaceae bacterium]
MSDDALANAQAAAAAAPTDATLQFRLAETQEDAGQASAAIESLRAAVRLQPDYAEAHAYLGLLLADTGDIDGAISSLRQAVALKPDYVRAWNNLGSALRKAGELAAAVDTIRKALALQPDYAMGHATLGLLQRDLGDEASAEASLRTALRLRPDLRGALVGLAGLLQRQSRLDESAQLYYRAIKIAPAANEWFQLGSVLAERGETAQARDAFTRALAADPRHLRAALGLHLTLPMLYDSAAQIASARSAYAGGLVALEASIEPGTRGRSAAEALDLWQWSNFLLPYQGQDDKTLQQRYAALVARSIDIAAPELRQPLPRRNVGSRRIRVGFASAFFKIGTVGMYFRRWITALDRSRFEIFAYHLHPGIDAIGSEIAASVDHFRHLVGPRWRVAETAAAIKDDELDVLVYLELGMHSMSFALAALRLAPVQCAAWGHPTTTGHPTVDYYLSAASMEPPGAAAHYSERLVLLPGIGTQYSPPAIPEDTDRARFSLPQRGVLLLCPQSLFKIHPDNDELMAAVVAAAPTATLVLFEGRHPALTDRFMRRLERAFAARGLAIRERAIVLPSLSHPDYLRVNRVCDAMLDTLHWSGGNTSLDALACGLPVVTLPGPLMRGRQTAGMLEVL